MRRRDLGHPAWFRLPSLSHFFPSLTNCSTVAQDFRLLCAGRLGRHCLLQLLRLIAEDERPVDEALDARHHDIELFRRRHPASVRSSTSCIRQCIKHPEFISSDPALIEEVEELLVEPLGRVDSKELRRTIKGGPDPYGCEDAKVVLERL